MDPFLKSIGPQQENIGPIDHLGHLVGPDGRALKQVPGDDLIENDPRQQDDQETDRFSRLLADLANRLQKPFHGYLLTPRMGRLSPQSM